MSERFVSDKTKELLLLLYDDGVDREELKALVSSAFKDGIDYLIGERNDRDDPSQNQGY